MQNRREDIRNIAIIAHVDHGKTTLVDGMLRQTGTFRENEKVDERMLDTMDQERERGITILAKNAAVRVGDTKMNIVDTPGHADFGGEVERGLSMVDGVLLLVDASEGPLPQTRFVLRKALERDLPIILVINKIDRHDARVAEVVDEVYGLFIDLDANDRQVAFPIVYTNARAGTATLDIDVPGTNLTPLFDTIMTTVPGPAVNHDATLQAQVTNLDASEYVGRLALCRIYAGELRKGQTVAWCVPDRSEDGSGETQIKNVRIAELYVAEAMSRVAAESASAGDICAIAGVPEIMIGDTIADTEDPRVLPPIPVDEPAIGMIIGINSSPLVGRGGGTRLTGRQVEDRLKTELIGNVSIRVRNIGRPDAWEVQGRGEMQLAVLVESMRREGFELTVGKPQVITKRDDNGKLIEPMELATVDTPDEHVGSVTQLLSGRKGRMLNMVAHGTGWTRLEFRIPARGLIGLRTSFLTETRGSGQIHHHSDGYEPWQGEIRTRANGSIVADRPGDVTQYAVTKLEDRGSFFVVAGDKVYEGSIVGESVRSEDIDVNVVREKHLTNHRSASADELVRMNAVRKMSLDEALEFIRDDECVEVTPDEIRMRKLHLMALDRHRARGAAKAREAGATTTV